jgi:hypothetical protein
LLAAFCGSFSLASAFAASVGTQSTRNAFPAAEKQSGETETLTYDPAAFAVVNALSLANTSVASARRRAVSPVTCVPTKRSLVFTLYSPETLALLGGESGVQIWTSAAGNALNETIANTRRGNNRVDTVKPVLVPGCHDAVLLDGWLSDDQDCATKSPEAAAIRKQYPGADIFFLVAASKSHIIGASNSGHPDMVTVVVVAGGVDAFVHMWGHGDGRNMGHQTGYWTNPNPIYATDRAVDGLFSGVMANPADSCPHGCPEIRVFAIPAVSFHGVPTGIPNESENGRTLDKFFQDKDVVCAVPVPTTIN